MDRIIGCAVIIEKERKGNACVRAIGNISIIFRVPLREGYRHDGSPKWNSSRDILRRTLAMRRLISTTIRLRESRARHRFELCLYKSTMSLDLKSRIDLARKHVNLA